MKRVLMLLPYALCLAATSIVGFVAVRLFVQNSQIRAELRSIERARPVLIDDSAILDAAWYEPVVTSPALPSSDHDGGTPVLLLVSSPDCESCVQTLRQWKEAIGATPRPRAFQIALATHRTFPAAESFVRDIQTLGLPARLVRIRDVVRFAMVTGISVAPLSLATHNSRTVGCAIGGVPSQAAMAKCLETLRQPAAVASATHVERSGQVQYLAPEIQPAGCRLPSLTVSRAAGVEKPPGWPSNYGTRQTRYAVAIDPAIALP